MEIIPNTPEGIEKAAGYIRLIEAVDDLGIPDLTEDEPPEAGR